MPTTTIALSLLLSLGALSTLARAGSPAGPGTSLAGGIPWESDYQAAFERAAKENRVVLLAVNMDGERANDRMVELVYRDPAVGRLCENTVNLIASRFEHEPSGEECSRFGTVECQHHRRVDVEARQKILKADANGYVVAPQHVLLTGDGTVLLSVPYEVRAAELEWCLYTAIRSLDPGFQHRLSPGARAPRRLVSGAVAEPEEVPGGGKPVTREEALELISEVKKGLKGKPRGDAIRAIMTVDEPEALDFIQAELRRGGGKKAKADPRIKLVHQIGVYSPSSYWELVAEFADDTNEEMRHEALVALEQLASPEAVGLLTKALRRERDARNRKNMLRALGTSGAGDEKARDAILKAIEKDKDGLVRVNAIFAAGSLAVNEEVDGVLRETLASEVPAEAAAAALAMGFSRRSDWVDLLKQTQATAEGEVVRACAAALAVLEKGDLKGLGPVLREVAGDKLPRERFFGVKTPER